MEEGGQQEAGGYTPREAIKRLFRAAIALVTLVAVGTLGYMEIENWNFSDSLYMVYITMSTIGFTEVRELDNTGRLWTAFIGIGGIEFRLEEFTVSEGSWLSNHSLARLDISKQAGARILAIRKEDGKFNTNPTGQDRISTGDTLIVLSTPEQIRNMECLMDSGLN